MKISGDDPAKFVIITTFLFIGFVADGAQAAFCLSYHQAHVTI